MKRATLLNVSRINLTTTTSNISNVKAIVLRDAINKSYTGTHGAAASVTNGGTVSHSCGATPVGCQIQPTVANTTMSVTAMSSTTFTVSSWRTNTTAAGISQTVYWECWCT